jgi:hypothetical protein
VVTLAAINANYAMMAPIAVSGEKSSFYWSLETGGRFCVDEYGSEDTFTFNLLNKNS